MLPDSSLCVDSRAASDAVKEGLQHPYALRSAAADVLLDGDPGGGEGEEDDEDRLDIQRGGRQQGCRQHHQCVNVGRDPMQMPMPRKTASIMLAMLMGMVLMMIRTRRMDVLMGRW